MAWDLDTLAKLGEFVGGSFVVVTLIYLAYQVRQNTQSLRSENYARVLERMSTLQSRLAADPDVNRVIAVGADDPAKLSPSDRMRLGWALYELFGAAEFMHHMNRNRALPAEVWERWDASLAWWLSHVGIRRWWEAKPAPMSTSFEAHVEDVLARPLIDPGRERKWRRFVAGESPNDPAP
ncbi:MAG TPA: hypothetical protein VK837_01730 [Longimicrobiales bacterium]|nr:hypothetical protein [Longimicrobiales bacterium]